MIHGTYLVPSCLERKALRREAQENNTMTTAQQQHSGTVWRRASVVASFSGCMLLKQRGLCLAMLCGMAA